jgi:anthranilate phosphoribosyltransferase
VNTFYVHPSDFKLPKAAPDALRGGEAGENADIAQRILNGERGAPRDIVLLNAGVSLLIAEQAATVNDGVERATAAIDSGAALAVLEHLVAVSNAGSTVQ